MLLIFDQFFFIGYQFLKIFEKSCEDIFEEIIAMKIRNISVVPEQLEP